MKHVQYNDEMKVVHMYGKELKSRFIFYLEDAGYNPYMFAEGLADNMTVFDLTQDQCLALGMSIEEFEGRCVVIGEIS